MTHHAGLKPGLLLKSMSKPKPTLKRRLMTWLLILLSLYVVYCGLLFFFQTKLIFPIGFAGQPGDRPPYPSTTTLEHKTNQGKTTAWLVTAPMPADTAPTPLAVFFHGNAELIDHQHQVVEMYHQLGVSVLLIEYRGYGHSDGTPSEKHIVDDALAILNGVLERDDIDADRLVLHGRSIGGGLAAQVALKTQPKALVVESTFKSLSGMALRYGVPPFLVTSPLKSESAFKKIDIPILILHGEHDTIVPVNHAHALENAGKQTTLVLFNADHNSLPGPGEVQKYEDAVREHLENAGVISARSVSE